MTYDRCPYYRGHQTHGVDGHFISCAKCPSGRRSMPFAKQMRDFVASYCEGYHSPCSGYGQDGGEQIVITNSTIVSTISPDNSRQGNFASLRDEIRRMQERSDLDGEASAWFCVSAYGQTLFVKDKRPCPNNWWRLTRPQVAKINKLLGGKPRLTT